MRNPNPPIAQECSADYCTTSSSPPPSCSTDNKLNSFKGTSNNNNKKNKLNDKIRAKFSHLPQLKNALVRQLHEIPLSPKNIRKEKKVEVEMTEDLKDDDFVLVEASEDISEGTISYNNKK